MSWMKVKLLNDDAITPQRAHNTDAGMDVFINNDIRIWPGQDKLCKTGISCAIPEGWALIVKEKSGRAVKDKLHVGACVIDCFSEDTKISTIDGEKLVKDLSIGDIVISVNQETEDITKNQILNIINSGIQEVFEILLENGNSIKLTNNSMVWTSCGWKYVKDLNENDELLTLL